MAYCLLGIFDVNMPMLYGEGPKAFMRLQEEIIKTSNDLSIFAFPYGTASHGPYLDLSQPYCDLFATSPRNFIGCGHLVDMETDVHWNDAFALTNKGLYFRQARLQVDIRHGLYSILLNCKPSKFKIASMYLRKVGPGLFARYDYRSTDTVDEMEPDSSEHCYTVIEEAYIIVKVAPSVQLQLKRADEYAIHVWSRDHDLSRALQVIQRATSSDRWDAARMQFLTKGERLIVGNWKLFPSLARRVVEAEKNHQAPSGHCYLVCGVKHFEYFSNPQAWVRLYSLEEWRGLEAKLGIITRPNDATSPLTVGYTSHRMTLSKSSTKPMTLTATIKLEIEEEKPRFELELDFNNEPEHGPVATNKTRSHTVC